ncbi:hypothetical protein [Streptomyces sp. NBC_00989]|uniref:hypothetical protein n=1 Tax=Streptomyces sp. NBC_00989 TaxID=2903705 RepID=UPI00386DAC15|nr:hypothetical protein OG714_38185 [Streptomyces sp. NBC_00989]
MKAGTPAEGASLLTMRISRDGGASYEAPATLAVPHQWADENRDPLADLLNRGWPPCRCPRHREAGSPPTS